MNGFCEICNTPIEIITCCSGHECGCMGQPSEPPVCSSVTCYDEFMIKCNKQIEEYKTSIPNLVSLDIN